MRTNSTRVRICNKQTRKQTSSVDRICSFNEVVVAAPSRDNICGPPHVVQDWAWWRLDGWGAGRPKRKEGKWGEGPLLAIATMFCLEFAYVLRLSVSIRKVAIEHPLYSFRSEKK